MEEIDRIPDWRPFFWKSRQGLQKLWTTKKMGVTYTVFIWQGGKRDQKGLEPLV